MSKVNHRHTDNRNLTKEEEEEEEEEKTNLWPCGSSKPEGCENQSLKLRPGWAGTVT